MGVWGSFSNWRLWYPRWRTCHEYRCKEFLLTIHSTKKITCRRLAQMPRVPVAVLSTLRLTFNYPGNRYRHQHYFWKTAALRHDCSENFSINKLGRGHEGRTKGKNTLRQAAAEPTKLKMQSYVWQQESQMKNIQRQVATKPISNNIQMKHFQHNHFLTIASPEGFAN